MKIVITGAYAIGTYLAQLLSRNKDDITLIDEDEERLARIGTDYDILTLQGRPASVRTLKDAGAGKADLFIAVTPDQNQNLNACILAKALGAKKTVAKVNDDEHMEPDLQEFFAGLGVDSLIHPEMLAAKDIISGLKMSWVRQRLDIHDGKLIMLGIKLRETCEILNRPLRELCGPDDPYHVVVIKRGGETIIPGGNDELKLYDLAYFMTTREYIPYIREIVGKARYADVKNVMVMGGGITAVRALKNMPEYMNAKVFEADPKRCEELNELIDNNKILVINGDGRDIPLLIEEGIKNTQAFVALTGNAETNILACLTAKRMGVRKTVAAVENIDYVAMAQSLDIGTIINKKAIAASHIYQMMLDADVMNVHFIMTTNGDVVELVPKEGSTVTRKPVKDLNLPKGITLGGLVRDGEGMLISGGTQIQAGDIVMVYCDDDISIKRVEKLFI